MGQSREKAERRWWRTAAGQAAERAAERARLVEEVYPHAWRALDWYRDRRGQDGLPEWPSWCWVPMAGAYAVVSGGGGNRVPPERGTDIAAVAALGAWRTTQGVYLLDDDLAAALRDTDLGDRLPSGVLWRLPEWAPYVTAPGGLLPDAVVGVWAHLEWDVVAERPELRLLLDTVDGRLLPVALHLDRPTVGEAITAGLDVARRNAAAKGEDVPALAGDVTPALRHVVEPALSCVLYLCTQEPDVAPEAASARAGGAAVARPEGAPTVWEVGWRIGAALREAAQREPGAAGGGGGGAGHASPRAHVRRAHWHTYLVGPRAEPRRELRWINPVLVGAGDAVPTVHRVTPD
ncbi:MAG: hypothetical protein AB1416_08320, partial [Actinomycetota bacterium]